MEALGAESVRSGKPICYTSVDSVFQIAAHEEAFGLERLYQTCRVARALCDPLRIGRVIARPFVGAAESGFRRTAHRKDFAIPAPGDNLLDRAGQAGRAVYSFGKIGDIFDHRNTGQEIKGDSNEALMKALSRIWPDVPDGSLVFVNLVDFDTEFGHRRDAPGYAACLEAFDRDLGLLMPRLRIDDRLTITADHGNDPTWKGGEHTRENAPVLCWGPGSQPLCVGRRPTFADIGASLARWLSLEPPRSGTSFF
jgi:phosphopentomutase